MKKICIFIIGIILIIISLFVIFLNRSNNGEYYITDNENLYEYALDYLMEEEYQSNNPDSDKDNYKFFFTYDGLGITEDSKYKYAYMWILGESYYLENGVKKSGSGYSMFFKFTFEGEKVLKYEIPKDGSEYTKSIKRMCIDNSMYKKIINYNSKLSNEKQIQEYYSKVTDSKNLEKSDIISADGLLFTIRFIKLDCIPVMLNVYDNSKYVLYTSYEVCDTGEICNSMLKYSKKLEGTYSYDVIKIIQNSIIADNIISTGEYEIYTGNADFVYMLTTDSHNKYLTEFLEKINVNLHTCLEVEYK